MANEAPEQILVRVDYDGTHDGTWLAVSQHEPPIEYTGMEPQYIRADLHQQALEAAEARGYARGIEAAVEVASDAFPDYEGGCCLQDQAARDLRDQVVMDIRALSTTPVEPVAEAASASLSEFFAKGGKSMTQIERALAQKDEGQ